MNPQTLAELTGARIVDISHPMTTGMPNHASHPPFVFSPYWRYGEFALADGYQGTSEIVVMSGHSGTHLDSLAHVACNGIIYGGHQVEEERRHRGVRHNGIDAVDPILRRGVLLDVAAASDADTVDPSAPIDAGDLAAAAERVGVEVREGDCALVRTGWSRHWGDPGRYLGEATGSPGIGLEAARWLAERGVALVGSDTAVVEHFPASGETLPVHMFLLAQRGVFLLENLDLDALAGAGAAEFLFVCLPLRIEGASGSPVRPVVIL